MAEKQKILIVDDDSSIAELVSLYLEKECYDTRICEDGEEALKSLEKEPVALIILDLMLPGIDGYEVCRRIRTSSNVPIIMLSAKGETFDKVLGLELGADDYMLKPFDTKELVARVKAVLRRSQHVFSPPLEEDKEKEGGEDLLRKGKYIAYEDLVINLSNYAVHYKGKAIDMPQKNWSFCISWPAPPTRFLPESSFWIIFGAMSLPGIPGRWMCISIDFGRIFPRWKSGRFPRVGA